MKVCLVVTLGLRLSNSHNVHTSQQQIVKQYNAHTSHRTRCLFNSHHLVNVAFSQNDNNKKYPVAPFSSKRKEKLPNVKRRLWRAS